MARRGALSAGHRRRPVRRWSPPVVHTEPHGRRDQTRPHRAPGVHRRARRPARPPPAHPGPPRTPRRLARLGGPRPRSRLPPSGRRASLDAPGRRRAVCPRRPPHGPGHRHRLGQVPGCLASGALRHPGRPGPRRRLAHLRPHAAPHHPLPLPHQGARRRPGRRPGPAHRRTRDRPARGRHAPGLPAHGPHRHLRRRHSPARARLGARPRRHRPDQPRLPPLLPAAGPRALEPPPAGPALHRHRRVPRLPRDPGRARRPRATPPPAARGAPAPARPAAGGPVRLGDGGRAGPHRGPPHRRRARRRRGRHR